MFLFCLHTVGLTGGETLAFNLQRGLLHMPTVTGGTVMRLVRVYACVPVHLSVCMCLWVESLSVEAVKLNSRWFNKAAR